MTQSATLDPSDSGSIDLDEDIVEAVGHSLDREDVDSLDYQTVVLTKTVDTELYSEAVALCREHLSRADRILLLIQDNRTLEVKESYGSKAAFVIMKEEISGAIIRRVRRKNRAIVINDALADEELGARQSIRKIGQRSVLCAPIVSKGKSIGILYADSISLVGAFTESELRWAIRLTTALGKSLSTAKRGSKKSQGGGGSSAGVAGGNLLSSLMPWQKSSTAGEDEPKVFKDPLLGMPKPNAAEKVVFLRSLACMLSAGFPIYGALDLLGSNASRFAPYASRMADDVSKGYPLSKSLSRYPFLFGKDYLHLIAVGENSGTLDISMVNLADAEERSMILRGKVIGALTYPAIIFFVCLLGCFLAPPLFLNDFFANLAESNRDLPFITKLIMTISGLMWNPFMWGSLVLGLLGLRAAWGQVKKRKNLMMGLEFSLMNMALVGDMFRDIATLKFVRALALQLDAGLFLNKSLKMSADASGSLILKKEVDLVVERVMAGEGLGFALGRTEFFPDIFVEFINVGEETGQMGDMCRSVERLIASRTEETIEMTQALVEPLAMAVVGILVGTVAIACLLPMVQMIQGFI